ncbi:serine hydrolase [Actinoplanes palleronii]|uniref:Beta-lactamase n=1 Tax=Actinoplanes palleronii TaxID=113570 RepID=A0ABQ4BFI3_9ACTN|nr:serine hydrolase [Actinoplanes palleronii]GIE69440.1 serine hydrolase [Actinoplanes palleronii]
MSVNFSRRSALGLGAVAAAATVGVSSPAEAAVSGPASIKKVYEKQKAKVGGLWHTHMAAVDATGAITPFVEDDADHVTYGYSVQKLAVATAVLDKVDRGELTMGTKVDLQGDIVLDGSGIYFLQGTYGDDLTVAGFLTAMLLVSDNTAVRLCGRLVPALEINEILAAKGFVQTRVIPVANPNRFYLGVTTPREMHDLLWRLATKTLLSPASCDFMLRVTRGLSGYHDGVRRVMSSRERERVATKYGADFNELGESRHEVGIMFDTNGVPLLTYAMFAEGLGDPLNYGATHPAVEAHAKIGRALIDNLPPTPGATVAPRSKIQHFKPVSGG